MSRLHAFDLLKFGIDVDCLPVLDVPIEGASDVIGSRAYGKKPEIVTAMGRAAAEGLAAAAEMERSRHAVAEGREQETTERNRRRLELLKSLLNALQFTSDNRSGICPEAWRAIRSR